MEEAPGKTARLSLGASSIQRPPSEEDLAKAKAESEAESDADDKEAAERALKKAGCPPPPLSDLPPHALSPSGPCSCLSPRPLLVCPCTQALPTWPWELPQGNAIPSLARAIDAAQKAVRTTLGSNHRGWAPLPRCICIRISCV